MLALKSAYKIIQKRKNFTTTTSQDYSPTIGDLRTFSKEGELKKALKNLGASIYADYACYVPLVQACINAKSLPVAKLVHAHMIQTGFHPDSKLETKVVIMYAKCTSVADARKITEAMLDQNVVAWSALIAAAAKQGQGQEALNVLCQMQRRGIQPDLFTFASVLQACGNVGSRERGREAHGSIITRGFSSDVVVGSALVDMYVRCQLVEDARQVFDKMPERNVVSWTAMIGGYLQEGCLGEAEVLFEKIPARDVASWNVMIAGYAQNGRMREARRLFREMPKRNAASWTAMVAGCARNGLVEEAVELFQQMPEKTELPWTAMIVGYAQNGRVDKAKELFDEMPQRDMAAWNAMLAAYGQNGQGHKARDLFDTMPQRDLVSWNAMISGYAQNGNTADALKLFESMPQQDSVSWNTMLAGYAQNGQFDEALKLFEDMPWRDVISWNTMIAGYAQNGRFDEALMLFREMREAGVRADSITFSSVLPAYANLAALHQGKEVHEDISRSGFQSNAFVATALIDMYAKCGSIEDARNVFDKMPERAVVSWNVMITAYAMHGYGKEAIGLFDQMRLTNVKPNSVTFVGILSACCHAGLVDDGWQYFYRMTQEYGITPIIQHYCCMVGLLGRAGRLNEALDFINSMPIKPNAAVWRSLLGACRVHNNIQLGEFVAERLFELDTEDSANYVLLSNVYAASGRWEESENVRKMVRDRRVKKMPGRSWIEVKSKVHTFLVGDRLHPQSDEIYATLESLAGRMKETGYVSDTSFVLHDVEEEQKDHLLNYHSEKLAIAFGLISTSPGTPIRIVKNLRVCGDCHSVIKLISKIVDREIVVRDANRFHRFKTGHCSCRDYW